MTNLLSIFMSSHVTSAFAESYSIVLTHHCTFLPSEKRTFLSAFKHAIVDFCNMRHNRQGAGFIVGRNGHCDLR